MVPYIVSEADADLVWDSLVTQNSEKPFIVSGSTVTDGDCTYLVTAVGEHSEWGRILAELATERDETPLQEKLTVPACLPTLPACTLCLDTRPGCLPTDACRCLPPRACRPGYQAMPANVALHVPACLPTDASQPPSAILHGLALVCTHPLLRCISGTTPARKCLFCLHPPVDYGVG